MQNDNLYKKLRFFALCLAIICMLLSLIKRANAQNVNYDNWADFVYNDTYSRMNNSTKTSMDNLNYRSLIDYLCEKFPYFMRYSDTNNNSVYYTFSIAEEFAFQTMWGSFSNNVVHVRTNYSSTSSSTNGFNYSYASGTNVTPIMVSFNGFNWNCIFPTIYISNDGYIQINNLDFYYSTSVYNMNYYENGIQDGTVSRLTTSLNGYGRYLYAFFSNISDSSEHTFDTFDSNCKCYVTQDYNRGVYNHLDNTLHLGYSNNTAGFECYMLETKGGIYLYADFSNLISISNAVGNSSTFSCDVHLNDTIQTITLDSTSEFYQYSVAYNEAYYSFPIIAFVSNYSEYENVWIDNIKVINTTSSVGGSATNTFIYITPIVIQGDSYNNGDLVNPNDVIIPDGEYAPPTNVEINENTYLVEFSNKDGLTFSEFHSTVIPNIYENNTTWVYMDKQTYTFRDFIEDYLGLNFPPKLIEYITGVNNEEEAVERMTQYLYDNAFTLTSDMVIFVYIDGDWKSGDFTSDDLTYWIYYTASGRIRAISQLMNSTNTNISRQLALSSSFYQYTKTKLNTIDKNLYEFANTQLGFNNTIISKLNNIDTLLSRIESVLNKILDSLKNLHLSQLDTIDTKISTIITNMGNSSGGINEDDTVAEAIQYYKSHNNNGVPTAQVYTDDKMSIWISGKVHLWLQGTDANTDKTNLINSVFDTLTTIYDSMKNNNDIFPNIQYFLDAIAKNNEYGYETHGDYMTRLFKGNVDISTYNGISE